MGPLRHWLLLLWLGWGAAAREKEESAHVVQATESEAVILPCLLGGLGPTPASSGLNLTWLGPLRMTVLNVQVNYRYPELQAGPDMDWGLLILNISKEDGMEVTCRWEGNPDKESEVGDYPSDETYDAENTEKDYDMNYSSSGSQVFRDYAQVGTPCNDSETHNWTWTAVSWIPQDATKAALSMKIWQAAPYGLRVYPDTIALLLPSVTSRDAGNYSCYWRNQSQHFQLAVSARSAFWQYFGKQHWIIWTVALGYLAICLGFLFGFLRFWHAFRARRQKKKQLRSPAMRQVFRKFFHAQRSRALVSGGTLLPLANGDGKEQVDAFSYENVLPDASPRGGQQSLQKGRPPPSATKGGEDDDEEYECPDSETEQKSDDEDNYENTQEEVKQEDVVLNDGPSYENSKKEICSSADSWYANSSQKGLRDLAQDPVSEVPDISPAAVTGIFRGVTLKYRDLSVSVTPDGDNYENVEEESPLSPGAARLIAGQSPFLAAINSVSIHSGLRLKLALDAQVDRQDGGSEASTGSQSYEEMSPSPSKGLQTSPEEDADSYENMESPNSLSLQKESSLDPRGEEAVFAAKSLHSFWG